MDQILRLNEFFVEGGKQNLSHVLLHINEPSDSNEAKKGYFFALSETNNASESFIAKFQDIIDRAQVEYYDIPNDAERDPFELVLEKMNGESFILENEQGELHSIVGAIRQKEIIFSYHGNPHLLLFYKNKLANYERMDLIRNNGSDNSQPEQLFSQIIQGKLSPSDYLFVGTPHLTDFFSHDRLEKIITTRSAEESAGHIEKVLSELKNGFSFGGLIIHLFKQEQPETVAKKLRPAAGTSSQSLQKLFHREQSTSETLSPSLLPKLDKLRSILGNSPATIEIPTPKNASELQGTEINSSHLTSHRPTKKISKPNYGQYFTTAGKQIWQLLKIAGKFLLQILIIIYAFFYNIFRTAILLLMVAVNYKNRRVTILENWRLNWRGRKENFKHLPLTTKLMLIGSIAMALGFTFSIFYIQHRQTVAAEELSFNNAIRDINTKISSIETSFIYKNDEQAAKDWENASEIYKGLICKTTDQKNVCSKTGEQLKTLETRLRKVSSANLNILTTFNNFPVTKNNGLIRAKNKLVAFSSNTSTLFVYDLLSGENKIISTYPSISGFSEAATPKENDYILFSYNKAQLMRLDTNDLSVRLIEISFPSDKTDLAGFVVYNRRLYSLDANNGTIFRHDTIKTGFGLGTEWLKDKSISLTTASDITIDGDVFISKNDGSVYKFNAGTLQPFSISGLSPALSTATKIWTYTDIPNLYFLEPAQKRLVVFEKNGHFVGQFTNSSLSDPTGFSIDFPAKTAYLLDSGKILKFPL
jgi:outer membrane protein assembly factor BamB